LLVSISFLLCPTNVFSQPRDTIKIDSIKRVKFTAYPALGYSPETSLSFGAVGFLVFRPTEYNKNTFYHRPSSISPYFLYTLNKQFLSAIDFEFYTNKRLIINATLRFFNYPDFYYGIGNDTDSDYETFLNKYFKWDGSFLWAINPKIFVGINYNWQINSLSDFDPEGVLIEGNINGTEGGIILGVGPIFRFDNRDDIFYPKKGFYFEFKSLFVPDALGNDYNFRSLILDFRSFNTVFSEKNILGIQVYYNQAVGSSIPFYILPRLGGDSRLRGINNENRYRDKHAYYVQIEGRRTLFWRIGGVIFAGVGDVNRQMKDFSFNTMKFVFGIGGRLRPFKNEKLNVRLDIGKGPSDQYAIYLAVKEAF